MSEKRILKIGKFHGGQNDNSDPRDLKPEESAYIQDQTVDKVGRVTGMGSTVLSPDHHAASGTALGGYGLHNYNSGYGFTPASGLIATNTHAQDGSDGSVNSSYWQPATPINTTGSNPGTSFGLAGDLLYPTSQVATWGNMTITASSGFNCIVLGMFLQRWDTADNGATFTRSSVQANPIPLFGTGGSGDFKLASEDSYTTGTFPNGHTATAHKWNSASSTVSNFVDVGGNTVSYGANNYLVVCDYDNTNDWSVGGLTYGYGTTNAYSFSSSFLSANNINLVFAQRGYTNNLLRSQKFLFTAVKAAINAYSSVSGFQATGDFTTTVGCAEGVGINLVTPQDASPSFYSFFSNYERDDDDMNVITTLYNADNVFGQTGGTYVGSPYHVIPQAGIIGAVGGGNLENFTQYSGSNLGGPVMQDLVHVGGYARAYPAMETLSDNYDSLKGCTRWVPYIPSGQYDGTTSWTWYEWYNQQINTGVGVNSFFWERYGPQSGSPSWDRYFSGIGLGSSKLKQIDTVTFSGTPASGQGWIVGINDLEHAVDYGDTEADGGTLTTSLTEWADEFADDIEAGAQSGAVEATSAGAVLTVAATNFGASETGNEIFAFSSFANDRELKREDDERLAFINSSGKLQIWSTSLNGWINSASINNLGWSGTTSIRPTMYSEGGSLRMSDGNFDNDNDPKVMKYFQTGDICGESNNNIVGHQLMDQDLSWKSTYSYQPSGSSGKGIIRAAFFDSADDYADWENTTDLKDGRWKFNFEVQGAVDGAEGGWNGKHRFHLSAVFEDGSESTPDHHFTNVDAEAAASYTDVTAAPVEWDFGENRYVRIRMCCHPGLISEGNWLFDERLIGFRLYHSKEEDNYGIYYHLGMIDLVAGFRNDRGFIVNTWYEDVTDIRTCTGIAGGINYIDILNPNEDDTFEYITGYDSNSTSLVAKYAQSTQSGRRAWVGNVSYVDSTGVEQVHNDRIIASPPNMFDTFPTPYNVVDVDTSDGDSITALEASHGRILQFKNNTLYIINVADSDLLTAYLESTHSFRGVSKPHHVCKIADGVAWMNEFGVYKYQGEDVINLMEDEGGDPPRTLINRNKWQNFFNEKSSMHYAPLDNHIIISASYDVTAPSSTVDEGDIYIYSLSSKSWVVGKNRFINNKICTNSTTMGDGTIVVLASGDGDDTNPGGSGT